MKRTKVFYNALILLATLLLTACQERKNTPPVISPPEKNLVLSDHISNQKVMSICEDKYGQIWIGITNTTAWTIHWDCPTTIFPTFIVTPTTDSG